MSKSNEYWKKRMELLEEAQLKKGEEYLADLEKQYMRASRNIEKELSTWYQRFAENNEISMAEAKKLLTTGELKEFKWDVQEYIKYGKENALDQKWMKELENASARVHISRLESLRLQMQQQIEVLYGNQVDDIDDLLRGIYADGYYHTAWEVQKGFNVGWDLQRLNDNQLNKVLSRPWSLDKKTFSDRLWTNKQQLIGNLQTHLAQSVITGKAPDEIIKKLSVQFKTDRNKAGRLVMTESAAFASMAQKDAFKDLDVEKFEIVATLDSHTSEICQDLDGHVFNMKDFEVGATAPPFHPWCRTTTVPYFDDEYGERAARDADGKTYYVPSNMKYTAWKKNFVKDATAIQNLREFEKYKLILGKNAPKNIDGFKKIKYNDIEWGQFKAYASAIRTGEISTMTDFDLYKKTSFNIDALMIGKITANGIKITGKSNHYIARTIGSVEQKRNGVSIEAALNALINPTEILDVKVLSNGKSQKFRANGVEISINPDTGILIQANPKKVRVKKI